MESSRIIKPFQVAEDHQARLMPGLRDLLSKAFGFQGGPETLVGGVIVAVCFAAHAGCDAVLLQLLGKGVAGVLRSAVRMVNEARARPATGQSFINGPLNEPGLQAGGSCPANDLAAVQIHVTGQVEPALGCREVGDIAGPYLVWPAGRRNLAHPVGGNRQMVIAVSGSRPIPALLFWTQAFLPHQPGYPPLAARLLAPCQFPLNARTAVGAAAFPEDIGDLCLELLIANPARQARLFAVGVVAASARA